MPLRVAVVPHTHWDREWYEPFETFRLRLVDTLDTLLDVLESDLSYRHFLLDGQMAAVDDYLEVRPEAEGRIRALATSGRLELGPWYALMDEFLVSGETIVRDLQMGIARAAAFGGAMPVGYLPDMFGHVAQMPQILRLAGFAHAVVWRGVPSSIDRTAFDWEAPDGSTVRAEYLPFGYGNGALLPDDAKALVRRVADHLAQMRPFLVGDLLLMNGSDHLPPQPWLGGVLEEANDLQDDYAFEISSLRDHLEGAEHDRDAPNAPGEGPGEGLQRWQGELRSGARANMLMGVTSNRVDVKQAVGAAERALERRAEPYAAIFQPAATWPSRLFELAWSSMVRNAAHDSVCACSVDEVVDAVLGRAASARRVAEGIAQRALDALAESMAAPGPVAVNPSARPRGGVVELVAAADARSDGTPSGSAWEDGVVQLVAERTAVPETMVLDAATARTVLASTEGTRIDDDAWIHGVDIDEDGTGIDVRISLGPDERKDLSIAEAKQDLLGRLGARPEAQVRVRLVQPRIRRVVARVAEVPGFGWRAFEPVAPTHPAVTTDDAGAVALSNGLVTVEVDRSDGTFSIDGVRGMGRIVDGGDVGDSYNYSPPAQDLLVDTPEDVSVTVLERGPVRARALVTARYRWPGRADAVTQRRQGEETVEVSTTLELLADERVLRVATSFVNPCRDHRVRVHLPLPEPAEGSEAESAFGTSHRGLSAEGRPDERGLPTFPARRFVRAGGLTVVCDRVTEYELVDVTEGDPPTAGTLALTVLRATGMLSRVGMAYRPFPAGPLIPVEGLQMLGTLVELRYALCRGPVDPWALADDVLLPLELVHAPGGGTRAASGSALVVSGAEVSAVRGEGESLELRVFNPGADPTVVDLGERAGWLVDLRGTPLSSFRGSFGLRAYGIATVRVRMDR